MSWNEPYRFMITSIINRLEWLSLVEIGCGEGDNLVNILKHTKGKQLGGIDHNPEMLEKCSKKVSGGFFKKCEADDIMLSDKAVDIVLADDLFRDISLFRLKKTLNEFKRVGRRVIVLRELHSENLLRCIELKLKRGYNMFNWKKLLERNGFYDVTLYKIPAEWCVAPWDKYEFIILATIPPR